MKMILSWKDVGYAEREGNPASRAGRGRFFLRLPATS